MPKEKAPTVTVTERDQQYTERLRKLLDTGAIFTPPPANVTLKEAGWFVCWVNSDIKETQIEEYKGLGYIFVEPPDIATKLEDVGARVSPDNRIVKGPRGAEVLMKCPTWYFQARQQKKTEENIRRTFDKKLVRSEVLSRVGAEHGSEAADFVNKSKFDVQDARERVSLDE